MNDKMKWYILIAAALLVGAIIGYFATANLSTEGNARSTLVESSFKVTAAQNGGLSTKVIVGDTLCACLNGDYQTVKCGDCGVCPGTNFTCRSATVTKVDKDGSYYIIYNK